MTTWGIGHHRHHRMSRSRPASRRLLWSSGFGGMAGRRGGTTVLTGRRVGRWRQEEHRVAG